MSGNLLKHLRERWRRNRAVQQLHAWLASADANVFVSVIQSTAANPALSVLKIAEFEGLRAVHEVAKGTGGIELRCFWENERSADREELRLARALGASSATRENVSYAKVRPTSGWRRSLRMTYLVGVLAGTAAVVTNVEDIRDFVEKVRHKPELTLENQLPLIVSSKHKEIRTIRLRGDSHFHTRVSELAVTVTPDPASSRTKPLEEQGRVSINTPRRSVDADERLELELTFDKVPAGRYLLTLQGKVDSGWNAGELRPADQVILEARDPMFLDLRKVVLAPSETADPSLSAVAYADFRVLFGQTPEKMQNLRFVIPGKWIGYQVSSDTPGVEFVAHSKNSSANPKGAVFVLRNVPSTAYSSQFVRVILRAQSAMNIEQWNQSVSSHNVYGFR